MTDTPAPVPVDRWTALKTAPQVVRLSGIIGPYILLIASAVVWQCSGPDWMVNQLFGAGLLAWRANA